MGELIKDFEDKLYHIQEVYSFHYEHIASEHLISEQKLRERWQKHRSDVTDCILQEFHILDIMIKFIMLSHCHISEVC